MRVYFTVALLLSVIHHTICYAAEDATNTTPPEQDTTTNTAVISTPPPIPAQHIATPEQVELQQSLQLAKTQTEGEWLWWQQDMDYLVLYHAESSAILEGALIILPDRNHHPAQHNFINELQQQMPQYGWRTITSMLPNYDEYVIQRYHPKQVDNQKAPSTKPIDDSSAQIDEALMSLQQAYWKIYSKRLGNIWENSLQLNNRKLVLIAHGLSAGLLIDWLHQNPKQQPTGLIILSPYHYDPAKQDKLGQYIADMAFPVLEISASADRRDVQASMPQHAKLSQKKGKSNFRQAYIEGSNHSYQFAEAYLTKLIRGWLKRQSQPPRR